MKKELQEGCEINWQLGKEEQAYSLGTLMGLNYDTLLYLQF